jgi:transposase-like protein
MHDGDYAEFHNGTFADANALNVHNQPETFEEPVPPLKRVKLDPAVVDGDATFLINQLATNPLPPLTTAETTDEKSDPKRKPRREFTAKEKIAILAELDAPNPPTIKELLEKYELSKSSFHRWRSPGVKERLMEMAQSGETQDAFVGNEELAAETQEDHDMIKQEEVTPQTTQSVPSLLYKGHKKRDKCDVLLPLKRAIQEFIDHNATLPPEEQYAIRSAFLSVKSKELRNELVQAVEGRNEEIERWRSEHFDQHQQKDELGGIAEDVDNFDTSSCPQPLMTPAELKALQAFKGSKSWSCQIASQLGLLTTAWSEAAEANSRKYLEDAASASTGALAGAADVKRQKKARTEFTAQDKVRILKEVDATNTKRMNAGQQVLTVEEICDIYGTSKSSLHRWRQQHKSGDLEAALEEGCKDAKRIFKDRLSVVKSILAQFVAEHGKIGFLMLQQKALEIRDELLYAYESKLSGAEGGVGAGSAVEESAVTADDVADAAESVPPPDAVAVKPQNQEAGDPVGETTDVPVNQVEGAPVEDPSRNKDHNPVTYTNTLYITASRLSVEEYQALRNFKCSSSWLREVAKRYGWALDSADDAKLSENWRARYSVLRQTYYLSPQDQAASQSNEHPHQQLQGQGHHHDIHYQHHDQLSEEQHDVYHHQQHEAAEDFHQAQEQQYEVHYHSQHLEIQQPQTVESTDVEI